MVTKDVENSQKKYEMNTKGKIDRKGCEFTSIFNL